MQNVYKRVVAEILPHVTIIQATVQNTIRISGHILAPLPYHHPFPKVRHLFLFISVASFYFLCEDEIIDCVNFFYLASLLSIMLVTFIHVIIGSSNLSIFIIL